MKYPISPEYGFYRHFKPPFGNMTMRLSQLVLKNSGRILKKDKALTIKECITNSNATIRIISPKAYENEILPCILFSHGGGFGFPACGYHYRLAASYAKKAHCTVAFVNYRLMPLYAYPVPLEHTLDALSYIVENAEKLLINSEKIAVYGDSAGGQLAAATAYLAKERYGIELRFQMLIYPVLDESMQTESMRLYCDTPVWNSKLNRRMWDFYFKNGREGYIPLLKADTDRYIPPAYIETAQFDCLHDEGVQYAEKLRGAGVGVILRQTEGTMHGFELYDCETTKKAVAERIDFMNKMFAE